MDAIGRDAQCAEAGREVAHELGRSAEIEVAVLRHIELLEQVLIQMSGAVEIDRGTIAGIGRAVADMTVMVRKPAQEFARLGGEGMLSAVAGAVQPPDLSQRCFSSKSMEHRENRRHADAGAQQDNGPRGLLQREAAARRTELHDVAQLKLVGNVSAGDAVGFTFDAETIGRRIGVARQ